MTSPTSACYGARMYSAADPPPPEAYRRAAELYAQPWTTYAQVRQQLTAEGWHPGSNESTRNWVLRGRQLLGQAESDEPEFTADERAEAQRLRGVVEQAYRERDSFVRRMRAKYHHRYLPSGVARLLGLHRTQVHRILQKPEEDQ